MLKKLKLIKDLNTRNSKLWVKCYVLMEDVFVSNLYTLMAMADTNSGNSLFWRGEEIIEGLG